MIDVNANRNSLKSLWVRNNFSFFSPKPCFDFFLLLFPSINCQYTSGLSTLLTFSHCPVNLTQIHTVYVTVYQRVVDRWVGPARRHSLVLFFVPAWLPILRNTSTRKNWNAAQMLLLFASVIFHRLTANLLFKQSGGSRISTSWNQPGDAGSKGFPVNDFTRGRKDSIPLD